MNQEPLHSQTTDIEMETDARTSGDFRKDTSPQFANHSEPDDTPVSPVLTPSDSREDLGDPEGLTRTKSGRSIAETLPLYREILFVAVICLGQLYTRKWLPSARTRFKIC